MWTFTHGFVDFVAVVYWCSIFYLSNFWLSIPLSILPIWHFFCLTQHTDQLCFGVPLLTLCECVCICVWLYTSSTSSHPVYWAQSTRPSGPTARGGIHRASDTVCVRVCVCLCVCVRVHTQFQKNCLKSAQCKRNKIISLPAAYFVYVYLLKIKHNV